MKTTIIVMGMGFACSITLRFLLYIDKIKTSNKILKLQNEKAALEIKRLRNSNKQLRETNSFLRWQIDSSSQINADKEIVEAIRKLMIYSHPDKGLCSTSDDFIKYKKLYERIRGGN